MSKDRDVLHEFVVGPYNFCLPDSLDNVRPVDFSKPCDQMLVVELFAGTATPSSSLRKAGFQVLAVDKSSGRNPSVKLVELDVTTVNGQTVLLQTLLSANIAYFHGAPPCGTASKARDKPLPSYMEHIKAEPLRSELHPLGLPSLQGLDWTRTQAANHLYAFTLLCTFVMVLRGAIVSVENPSSSYLWLVMYQFCQQNEKLMAMWLALEQVHFQACMHGSDRDKWTCWYSTKDVCFNSSSV